MWTGGFSDPLVHTLAMGAVPPDRHETVGEWMDPPCTDRVTHGTDDPDPPTCIVRWSAHDGFAGGTRGGLIPADSGEPSHRVFSSRRLGAAERPGRPRQRSGRSSSLLHSSEESAASDPFVPRREPASPAPRVKDSTPAVLGPPSTRSEHLLPRRAAYECEQRTRRRPRNAWLARASVHRRRRSPTRRLGFTSSLRGHQALHCGKSHLTACDRSPVVSRRRFCPRMQKRYGSAPDATSTGTTGRSPAPSLA